MSDLYNVLLELCTARNITGYRMCKDVGIQPSIMTDLKMGRRSGLKAETAQKIADYFDVSVGYLLGAVEQKEKTPTPTERDEREISDDDIKFALFGDKTIDDETYESVKNFARFAAEQKRKRQESEQ